jgi:hypothetical protein
MYVFYLIPGGITVAKMLYLLAYYLILKDDIHLMEYFRYKVGDNNAKPRFNWNWLARWFNKTDQHKTQ